MLKISYVGCKTQLLPIKDRRRFVVTLKDDSQTIAEVQIKGKRRTGADGFNVPVRELSGAQQTISMKTFEGMSVASVDDALQGRIAGLDIVANSGDLGSGSSLRVRGTTSINSNSEPLILLNDIPFDSQIDASFDYNTASNDQFATLLNISPEDIEDITVLKDGAACAIWGARGANGIISIRTKKGVTGPTRVTYSYRLSGNWQPEGMKMLNGDDYTMLMKQAYFNRNQDEREANVPEFNYDPNFSEYEQFNNNTNWVKEVSQMGWTHDHSLSISGGGQKARFRASLGYYNQTGTVIEQQMDRFSTRMNLEYQVSERLKFTSDFSMTYTNNDRNYEQYYPATGSNIGLLDVAYRKLPNVGIYRQDNACNNTGAYYNILPSS
jgi:TonB-dependent SusC/RagA subfamily outer membrane receptor